MLDEELRSELADWARTAQRLGVPDIEVLRGRIRRRRAHAAGVVVGLAAAGAAVSLVVALMPAGQGHAGPGPAQSAGHGHRRHGAHRAALHRTSVRGLAIPAAWYPAGSPPAANAGPQAAPYFVTVTFQQAPADAVITNWMTGSAVGRVQPPIDVSRQSSSGMPPTGFVGVAAAGDDRTFVLADAGAGGLAPGGSADSSGITGFYELRLGADGHPLPLSRLAVPAPLMARATTFALSPDGRLLAIETARPSGITVVSLATGKLRAWYAAGSSLGGPVSFAGNRDLAFSWHSSPSANPSLKLLDIAARGNQLQAAPVIVSASVAFDGFTSLGAWDPLVSADGSTVFLTLASGQQPASQAEVVQISLLTGRPVRAVLPATGESGHGTWCGALWSDPSGQQVAAECGLTQGIVSYGQLSQRDLHAPMSEENYPPETFAW
jgi:hypothetical protein